MSIEDFLRTVDVFRDLEDQRLRAFAHQCVAKGFAAGDRIITRGEPGDAMYILRAGTVRIPVVDEHGREKFVAILGPGEVFGEMALLLGEPRNADVYAADAVDCLVVEKEPLQAFLRSNSHVAAVLTEILGKRLLSSGQIQDVGKYRIIGKLGRGGMSIVYEGVYPTLDQTVAVKMLSHELVYDEEFLQRFRQEATIIAGLDHKNIVRVYDYVEAYATYFIVMEKARGQSLRKIRESEQALGEERTRHIIRQIASALDCAHRHGIVHRDVKPDNVMVDAADMVKLMDFGIAKKKDEKSEGGEIIGTPEYMSPEQATGRKIDGRSDIYSLGIMAFEMLTGQLPFETTNYFDIIRWHERQPMPRLDAYLPGASAQMIEFVARACQKDPDQRFQSCGGIIEHFGGFRTAPRQSKRAKMITLVYPVAEEERVALQMEEFASRAEEHDDIVARISDLGAID